MPEELTQELQTEELEDTQDGVAGSEEQQTETQADQSSLKSFMQEKGFASEDDMLNYLRKTEDEKKRYEEELDEYNRLSLERDTSVVQDEPRQAREELKDPNKFIEQFAKDPYGTLDNYVKEASKPLAQQNQALARDLAILELVTSKDYYDGMENDVAKVLRTNRNTLITLADGSRAALSALSPVDKIRAAKQIISQEKKVPMNTQQSTQVKKVSVTVPKKTSSTLESKSDSSLTADELRKKYGLKVDTNYT